MQRRPAFISTSWFLRPRAVHAHTISSADGRNDDKHQHFLSLLLTQPGKHNVHGITKEETICESRLLLKFVQSRSTLKVKSTKCTVTDKPIVLKSRQELKNTQVPISMKM